MARCGLSITIICFKCSVFDINISQSNIATCSKCGGIFNYHFTRNLLLSLPIKKLIIGQLLAKLWAKIEWLFSEHGVYGASIALRGKYRHALIIDAARLRCLRSIISHILQTFYNFCFLLHSIFLMWRLWAGASTQTGGWCEMHHGKRW